MELILRVTSGPHAGHERSFPAEGSYLVGRSPSVPLSLPDDRLLSREHFVVEIHPTFCDLVDLGSTNGTKINGLRVERARLGNGDVITVGESSIEVEAHRVLDDSVGVCCAGCGVPAGEAMPRGDVFRQQWLCPGCTDQRMRFPATNPNYLIERMLGSGGMGHVYLARELTTNKPVAIKMMVPTGTASPKAKEYFRREMFVLRDLLNTGGQCHPNIVTFYDIFEIDGQFQLVMEYVPGRNALDWVRGLNTPLPIASAARVGRLLLSALDYAHARGYVHRDVKPSNLLTWGPTARPRLKLSDFGLAKNFRENTGFINLTRPGDVGGSVGFISPEHILDFKDLKEPADIYSAGATLYYLLTLRYPFLNFDPFEPEAHTMILENPPVPLRAHRPDAPEGLERVLARALAKHPDDRWKSAAAMASALRPFVDE